MAKNLGKKERIFQVVYGVLNLHEEEELACLGFMERRFLCKDILKSLYKNPSKSVVPKCVIEYIMYHVNYVCDMMAVFH